MGGGKRRDHNEASAGQWIGDCLTHSLASFEAVYLAHMLAAWRETIRRNWKNSTPNSSPAAKPPNCAPKRCKWGIRWPDCCAILTRIFPSPREVRGPADHRGNLYLCPSGHSPRRSADLTGFPQPSFPLAWSCAAANWNIEPEDAIAGYLWAWLENQVMAAMKAVPLGQTAGQRCCWPSANACPNSPARPRHTTHQARNFLPAFALASSLHETQYTRIFRS
jgi:urease accessory protein